MLFRNLICSLLAFGLSPLFAQEEPKGAPFGFPEPQFVQPDSPVKMPLVFFPPAPADSQVTGFAATVHASSPIFDFAGTIDTSGTALRGWTFTVTGNADSVRFAATAPAGVFFTKPEGPPSLLVVFPGLVSPSAADKDSIMLTIDDASMNYKGKTRTFSHQDFFPGLIFIGQGGGPGPQGAPLGLPFSMQVPKNSPMKVPLLFFASVPPDSQVSGFAATVRAFSPIFDLEGKVDTVQGALAGWNFVVTGNSDTVRFQATAPPGVYFTQGFGMPGTLLFYPGNVLSSATNQDSIVLTLHNVSMTYKGKTRAFNDQDFNPGVIRVGTGEPPPGPGGEAFMLADTNAAPGDDVEILFGVTAPFTADSQLTKIRGVIKTFPSEVKWNPNGRQSEWALDNWSYNDEEGGDSLVFEATAAANEFLVHEGPEPMLLARFAAKVKPEVPQNSGIQIRLVQFFVTQHGVEKSLGEAAVRRGVLFVSSSTPPPPPPPPPPSSSHDGRTNLGLYGGSISDLAFDKNSGVLVASVNAAQSVFSSTDSGLTWFAAFPEDSLEFYTENQTRGFGGRGVQVESSGGYTYARTNQEAGTLTGSQVTNDGENWRTLMDAYLVGKLLNKRFPNKPTGGPRAIQTMSSDSTTAIVAGGNAVFRTTNAGLTWSVSIVPDTTKLGADGFITALCLRRNDNSGKSFLALWKARWDDQNGKLYSTVNGVNFTPVYIVAGGDTAKGIGSIASHPTHDDTIWVAVIDASPSLRGLWRSFNAGATWTRVHSGMNAVSVKLFHDSTLPGTDHLRVVDGNSYSDDLGDSWTDIHATNDPYYPIVSFGSLIGFIPDADIYLAQGDGTPSRSTNGIDGTYYLVRTGLEAVTIWKIAQIPNEPDKVYLATSAGVAYTSVFTDTSVTSTAKWVPPYGNFPITPNNGGNTGFTAIAIDPNNTSHIVAANGNGIFSSTTGGFDNDAWTAVSYENVTGLDVNAVKSRGGSVRSIAFLTSDSIFAALNCGNVVYGTILLSTDGGASWKTVTSAGQHNFKSIAVAYNAVLDSTVLFAGGGAFSYDNFGAMKIDTGFVYKSLDRGATWFRSAWGPYAVFNPMPVPLPVNDLVVKPGSIDTVYFACGENLSNAIARTYDGGTTLETIGMEAVGPREGAFEAVAINKNHPDSIYFAIRRDILVYDATADQATTLFRGYPGELTHALLYDDLTMGSSAGFFEVKTPVITSVNRKPRTTVPLQMQLFQNYPNPFNPSTKIVFSLSERAAVELEVFNILGQRVAVILAEKRDAGRHEVLWQPTNVSTGIYFYRLQTRLANGKMNAITKKLMFVK
jgi:hypothetical protein